MNEIERAIRTMWRKMQMQIDNHPFDSCTREDYELAISALQEKLDREREPGGWIKLSEGPPEEYTPVFIAIDGKRIEKAEIRRSHNGRYWYGFETRGSIDFYSVTHWMPLPELPKEGKE